jgi:hypothetical protein
MAFDLCYNKFKENSDYWMLSLRFEFEIEGVGLMTRFYDVKNDYELAAVEDILEAGGVEYSVQSSKEESEIKEVLVAEEDLSYVEELLYLSKRRLFCSLAENH